MSDRTKWALRVAGYAIVLGMLGDWLLRCTPVGIGLGVFVTAAAAGTAILSRRRPRSWGSKGGGMVIPLLFFAWALAWRDSAILQLLDWVGLLGVVALVIGRPGQTVIGATGLLDCVLRTGRAVQRGISGCPVLLQRDIAWDELPRGGMRHFLFSAVRGLSIALPLVLLFGVLLASADSHFGEIWSALLKWDVVACLWHLAFTVVIAWVAGGWLRTLVLEESSDTTLCQRSACIGGTLGIVETAFALGLIDALFGVFVFVQFQYFFGGNALIHSSTGISYADYARSGFFELTAVSALVLPVLLTIHYLLRKDHPAAIFVYNTLAAVQVLLIGVIIVSAADRLQLYQSAYGQTELRYYTMAFIAWLAVLFGWFVVTVLPGRKDWFGIGALASAFGAVALLNAANPASGVVRANLERLNATGRFDADYAVSLGDDAVPSLITVLPRLTPYGQRVLARRLLLDRPAASQWHTWRSWNWSRTSASHAVGASEPILESALHAGDARPLTGNRPTTPGMPASARSRR